MPDPNRQANTNLITGRRIPGPTWQELRRLYPRVVPREVLRAREAAGEILDKANEERSRLLSRARGEARDIRRKAFRQGYRQGMESVVPLILEIRRCEEELLERIRRSVVALAVEIARRILLAERIHDETYPDRLAAEILGRHSCRGLVTFIVPPGARARFAACRRRLLRRCRNLQGVDIRVDESLAPEDCRILTEIGEFDAGLESQLEVLRQALLDVEADRTDGGEHEDE